MSVKLSNNLSNGTLNINEYEGFRYERWGSNPTIMADLTGMVRFKLNLTLSGGYVSKPAGTTVEFAVPELRDEGVKIVLRDPPPEEAGPGHRLVGFVLAERRVSCETEEFVRAFIDKRLISTAAGVSLPIIKHNQTVVRENGAFEAGHTPRLENCPEGIQGLLGDIEAKLLCAASRFLHLLRWQQGVDFGSTIISHSSLFWRTCEDVYHLVPARSPKRFKLGISKGVEWGADEQSALLSLWGEHGADEPLARRLLRSAIPLAEESPEAAILLLATSLEAGVKRHVCFLEPANKWLLDEGPSPSVFKIFTEYLPELYSRKGLAVPSFKLLTDLTADLRHIFRHRNLTAHRGERPAPSKGFEHYFQAASDILYLLDVIEGRAWAKTRVSPGVCKLLSWPAPSGFGSLEVEML